MHYLFLKGVSTIWRISYCSISFLQLYSPSFLRRISAPSKLLIAATVRVLNFPVSINISLKYRNKYDEVERGKNYVLLHGLIVQCCGLWSINTVICCFSAFIILHSASSRNLYLSLFIKKHTNGSLK